MFNWFKGKQNLVANDVKNAMLTSNFVSFKLGEKLVIPEDIVCFVRYKDKTYKELHGGDYALNKEFLLDLYTKQLKSKDKVKKLKADLYFVNLKPFNLEFEYVDKLPLNKVKEKFLINVKFSIQVQDSKIFSKTLIYENTAPTAETTKNLIISYAENFVRTYFLKQKLTSPYITTEQQKAINSLLINKFKKLGVCLNESKVDIFKKTNKISHTETKQFTPIYENIEKNNDENFENIEEKPIINIDQQQEKGYNLNNNSNTCPKCNNKLIKGSIFCHKCGYRR